MNTLAQDVEIKGTIKFAQALVIEGKIEGDIQSPGVLTIGDNGRVKGEIRTGSVTIFGTVEGNVTASERCEVRSSGSVQGDITAGTFAIEEGATFIGRSRVGKSAVAAAK